MYPRGGPPTLDGSLQQGSTKYIADEKREIYLFKNFTSRHYLIHKERFLNLLPMKPIWLSWREPFKSTFFGKGKLLCWENIVERKLQTSNLWRADLMTDQAWSMHITNRDKKFYEDLPNIIKYIEKDQFPKKQAGHFDLIYSLWC